ncbi:MAG: Stf0 family sulfotransferase [Mycolicibacterium sp.]|uniref:Stf0 family sulfotransferase n=1 Tax=Mycolicibacterium sp. TaxID=2320850 RepID=UPI003D0E8FC5
MSGLSESEYATLADEVHCRYGDCPSGAAGLASWLGVPYRRYPGTGHDMNGPDYDQPPRTPQRSLVLAATYRSGSTLLAEDLITAGGYGWPLEYFQTGAQERRFARFPESGYINEVMRHRTASSGVFGVKLFPADLRASPHLWDHLPDPVVVWVRRRDRVGQSVSAWRALNGGPWRAEPGAPSVPPPAYDYDVIRRLVGLFAWEDRWWGERLPDGTVTVWFEDLAMNHHRTREKLLVALEDRGMPPDGEPAAVRLARQADADSREIAQRFAAEFHSH